MQIFVKTLTGKTVTLQVEDSAQVMDIKTKIEEKEGIPIYRQTLYNGNKILEQDQNSLSSYNVFNEATLQMILRWKYPNPNEHEHEDDDEHEQSKKRNEIGENSLTEKKDACAKFQDRLVRSMTFEMNREVKEKMVAFEKLEEDRLEINLKVSELEDKRDQNDKELNKRNQIIDKSYSGLQLDRVEALKEKQVTDQKILELQKKSKNLEFIISDKETKMKKIVQEREEDKNKTEKENKKLEQEISTLKRKRVDVERKENDLFKKKKVNDGLVVFISNTIEEKKRDLECPVCFETAEVPIFRCKRGHLICNKCLPNLDICPECRKPYRRSPIRNRYAEKQVEEIQKLSAKRKAILDGV